MRYRLRTLLIVLAVGPPTIFYGWVCILCVIDGLRPSAVPLPLLRKVPTARTSQSVSGGGINVQPKIVIDSDDEKPLAIDLR